MKSPKSAIITLALVGAGFTLGLQAASRQKTAGATTVLDLFHARPSLPAAEASGGSALSR
jgi:hypothetical protein